MFKDQPVGERAKVLPGKDRRGQTEERGIRGYFYHCKGIINWEELLLLITEKRGWVLPLPIHAKLLPTV